MKKNFVLPEVSVDVFAAEDVIAASGGMDENGNWWVNGEDNGNDNGHDDIFG